MAMEIGLYAQVIMIRQMESDDKKEKEKTNNITSNDNQQDQDVGFNIDHEWLKENFMTHEPDFY